MGFTDAYYRITNLIGRPTLSGAIGLVAGTVAGIATAAAIPTTAAAATFALPLAGATYYVTKRVVQFGASQLLQSDKLANYSIIKQLEQYPVAWNDIPPTQPENTCTDALLINTADLGNHMTCAWISSSVMNYAVGSVALAWNWQAIVIIGAGNLIAELASRTIRIKVLSKFEPWQQFGVVVAGFGITTGFTYLSINEVTSAGKTIYNLLSGSPATLAFAFGLFKAYKDGAGQQTGDSYTNVDAKAECCNNITCCVVVQSP